MTCFFLHFDNTAVKIYVEAEMIGSHVFDSNQSVSM